MQSVSPQFLTTIRQSHTVEIKADIWYQNAIQMQNVPISGGQVSINSGTGVRRNLDMTIPDVGLWGLLSTPGIQIRPYRGVRYAGGQVEMVPLGVFMVDSVSMSAANEGSISISSAPDRWSYVQRARFETPQSSIATNTAKQEIARLVVGAISVGVNNIATSTALAGALTYEKDREEPINALLNAIGAEAYFDTSGQLQIINAPLLGAGATWSVDAGEDGILLGGSRRRDRTRTYNVVVVTVAALDGQVVPAPVVVADTDATSPTYVGGPMGRVPYFYESPIFIDAGQMLTAGKALLNKVKGVNAQLDIESAVNPALDRGDVIFVKTGDGTLERHMVVNLTIPLTADGTQTISTQSSRPDGEVPGGE
jgi:hypothetical protein